MMSDEAVPNLFVIGVPKAGTTSLVQWLGDHPQIGRSTENELRYLMDDTDPLCRADGYSNNGLNGYAAFYNDRVGVGGVRHLLDVSPQYYYQTTAKKVISNIPNGKVIFVLRRPSARIYSLYNYSKNNKAALSSDMAFSEFVSEVRRGDQSDALRNRPMLRYALEHSDYAPYVKEWQDLLGFDNVHVLLFEDLVNTPGKVLAELSCQLGIDADFYQDYGFPVQNESFALRNRHLHRLMQRSRRKLPGWLRRSLKPAYYILNTGKLNKDKTDSDRETIAALDQEFAVKEAELASLLGKESGIWVDR